MYVKFSMCIVIYIRQCSLQYYSLLDTDNPQPLIKRHCIVTSIAQLSFNEWEFLQFQKFIK